MQATSGELWWSTLADDSYSSSNYLFQTMWQYRRRWFSVVSQHSSALFLWSAGSAWQELKGRYSWISKLRGLFLCEHCKKTPHHPKWPCVLNLSRASCMFGHVDIKWVTVMCAGCGSSEKSSLAWQSSCADTSPKWEVSTPCPKTKRTREDAILWRKGALFFPHFPRQNVNCYSQDHRVCCEVKKQRNHASNKWGALMKHSGRWLIFEQQLFVPNHVTVSQKMHLVLLVSIPAPCFFDQQAVHDKNSKGDIRGFPNWDWKISKQSPSISEHCKKTAPHTKWPCLLQPFWSFLHVWPYRRERQAKGLMRNSSCERSSVLKVGPKRGKRYSEVPREAARCTRKRRIQKPVESCTVANHVTSLALRVSIPLALFDIKWGTSMLTQSRCHPICLRYPNLFQWEVPPADVPTAKRLARPLPRQPVLECRRRRLSCQKNGGDRSNQQRSHMFEQVLLSPRRRKAWCFLACYL